MDNKEHCHCGIDANLDDTIAISDATTFGVCYTMTVSDAQWFENNCPLIDSNTDGIIDITDAIAIGHTLEEVVGTSPVEMQT